MNRNQDTSTTPKPRTVLCSGIVEGFGTLKDGTVKVTIATNEIDEKQASDIFMLNRKYVKMYLTNSGISTEMVDKIDALDLQIKRKGKSPSQKLKNLLYILWNKTETNKSFEEFYIDYIDDVCHNIRESLT